VDQTLITGAVFAAATLLLGNSGTLIRLHQKLNDHIDDEENNQKTLKDVRKRLRRVEKKLPNGEISLMYEMMKDMYRAEHGGLGKFKERAAQVERACRLEQLREEQDDIEEIFDVDS
jgi:hypothetical protein